MAPVAWFAPVFVVTLTACTTPIDDTSPPDNDVVDSDVDTDTDSVDTDRPPRTCEPPLPDTLPVGIESCQPGSAETLTLEEKWRLETEVGVREPRHSVYQANDDNADGLLGIGDRPDIALAGLKGMGSTHVLVDGSTGAWETDTWGTQDLGFLPARFYSDQPIASLYPPRKDMGWNVRYLDGSRDVGAPFPETPETNCAWDLEPARSQTPLAIGDATGDGLPEIGLKHGWISPEDNTATFGPPAIRGWPTGRFVEQEGVDICVPWFVDLDREAPAEVLSGATLLDGDGSVICQAVAPPGTSFPADLDGDGDLDFVHISKEKIQVFDSDCQLLRERTWMALTGRQIIDLDHSITRIGPMAERGVPSIGISIYPERSDDDPPGAFRFVPVDTELSLLHETWLQYWSWAGGPILADVDGDGIMEMFYTPYDGTYTNEIQLREIETGDVIAALPRTEDVRTMPLTWADIDGDLEGELLGWQYQFARDSDGGIDGSKTRTYFVAWDLPGAAPAPRYAPYDHGFGHRAGHRNEDGTYAKAGDYPPFSLFNVINAPWYAPEVDGYDVDLDLSFADVCTLECDRSRLITWVELANSGPTDLIREVELQLVATLDDGDHIVDRVTVDGLPSGERTEPLRLQAEYGWSQASAIRVEVIAPGGWPNALCDGLPVTGWDGALCPAEEEDK